MGNRASGTLPASLSAITSLTRLYARSVAQQLARSSADAAACLRRDVQNCPEPCISHPALQPDALLLTGTVPESYAALTSLTQVGLSGNLLTGSLPSWLATAPNLRVVGFNHNAFTGSVGVLASGGNQLTYLHLGDNKLDGTIPKTVSHLSLMRYLYLENTLISGTIPAELGQLQRLKFLYLQKTRLVGTLPPELGNLTQLQYFCAGDCQIGGAIPSSFGGMQSLIFFGMYNMALSSTLPPSLSNISTLQYLVVHQNNLIGTIPNEYGNLSLALLDAHDNKLYGRVPEGLVASNLAGTTILGLDDTLCASHPLAMSDYEYTSGPTAQGFSLSTVCTPRPCPANTWSRDGHDSDGSAGGCQPCPPGSSIADLGGVASNNSAAHAGASSCSTGDPSVHISAAALPVCATGYSGAPVLDSSDSWSGCVRTDTIIGAVVGSVLGACFLVVVVTLCWRRKRRLDVALQEIKLASGDRSLTGSSGADDAFGPDGGNAMVVLREDVVLGDCIGTGGFANVHAASWRGTAVAVKVFFADALRPDASVERSTSLRAFDSFIRGSGGKDQTQSDSSRTFAREMRLLQRLRHPNICALYGVVVGQTPPLLLMELCVGGSLSKLLRSKTLETLGWIKRQQIGVGVACGVDFLHSQSPPVIHRDLKSANVVMSESLVPKICDFGLSSFIPGYLTDTQANKTRGTPKYMAPELIMPNKFRNSAPQAVDVFGIGVVLHDLAHLGINGFEPKTPSPQESSSSSPSPPGEATVTGTFSDWGNVQVRHMPENLRCSCADAPTQELMSRYHHGFSVDTAPHCPPKLAAVISRCLSVDPTKRPTANQALNELLALTGAEAKNQGAEAPQADLAH